LGLVHDNTWSADLNFFVYDQTLLYYNRGGSSCGSVHTPPTLTKELNLPVNTVVLFPNPATNKLTVAGGSIITQLSIATPPGQTVYNQVCNSDKVEIDVTTLSPGMYFVRINGSIVQKFVKE
jgi:Secretion system C-terminal sorting domain